MGPAQGWELKPHRVALLHMGTNLHSGRGSSGLGPALTSPGRDSNSRGLTGLSLVGSGHCPTG